MYVPTVPSTPLLRSKGEVEVTAAIRGFSSLEAGVAWAPAPRLFVAGETALQTSEGSITSSSTTINYRNMHQQIGLGLGTYRLLGKDQSIYVGALGGMGLAKAEVYGSNVLYSIIPVLGPLAQYRATYLRGYGQVYIAHQMPRVSYGLSVRSTVVGYTSLLYNKVPIQPPNRFFLEPHFFVRVGQGPFQGIATVGGSSPGRTDRNNPSNEKLAPSTLLISMGVAWRPHLLRRHQQEVSE